MRHVDTRRFRFSEYRSLSRLCDSIMNTIVGRVRRQIRLSVVPRFGRVSADEIFTLGLCGLFVLFRRLKEKLETLFESSSTVGSTVFFCLGNIPLHILSGTSFRRFSDGLQSRNDPLSICRTEKKEWLMLNNWKYNIFHIIALPSHDELFLLRMTTLERAPLAKEASNRGGMYLACIGCEGQPWPIDMLLWNLVEEARLAADELVIAEGPWPLLCSIESIDSSDNGRSISVAEFISKIVYGV